MKKNLIYKIFLVLFAVLYISTAFISFLHAIEFFSIGNIHWMSIVLSAVFEVGQMTVLMSLLMSENSKKMLPWFLMAIFTSVQVVSNVYSVTKFIMLSDVEYYKYLEQALKFLIQGIPQDMILTVIAWIIGGLLPICALLLTAMCASQIRIMESNNAQGGGEDVPQVTERISTEEQETEPAREPVPESNNEVLNDVKEEIIDEPETPIVVESKQDVTDAVDTDYGDDFSDVVGETPAKPAEKKPNSIINRLSSAVGKIKTANSGARYMHEGARVASDTYFESPDRP